MQTAVAASGYKFESTSRAKAFGATGTNAGDTACRYSRIHAQLEVLGLTGSMAEFVGLVQVE